MIGALLERLEDAALLTGAGGFVDDLSVKPGTAHVTVAGAHAQAWSPPFSFGVRQPMEHWCITTERVRYAGEPVAEDALALLSAHRRGLTRAARWR